MKLYGITNCDTVKKARAWLDTRGRRYEFVDFKRTPPTPADVARWLEALGRDAIVNRRGTTWRRLTPAEQAMAETDAGAIALLVAHPSLIRRPIVETRLGTFAGFDLEKYQPL
jgi:Spx/MgsR family transcriptional regulator